jgi:predicted MFS family arabinose efflux permease
VTNDVAAQNVRGPIGDPSDEPLARGLVGHGGDLRDRHGRRQVRIGLLVTFTIVVAHFGTYTYVSAFLEEVTRVDLGTISVLLLVYGGAGLAGNVIGLARASDGANEAATVLFTSSFQATISVAALLGGIVIDGASLTTLMLLGGAAAAVTVGLVAKSSGS